MSSRCVLGRRGPCPRPPPPLLFSGASGTEDAAVPLRPQRLAAPLALTYTLRPEASRGCGWGRRPAAPQPSGSPAPVTLAPGLWRLKARVPAACEDAEDPAVGKVGEAFPALSLAAGDRDHDHADQSAGVETPSWPGHPGCASRTDGGGREREGSPVNLELRPVQSHGLPLSPIPFSLSKPGCVRGQRVASHPSPRTWAPQSRVWNVQLQARSAPSPFTAPNA